MPTNELRAPSKGQPLVTHGTLFSLLWLVSIPAALRHKTDWSHVAMDPMVNNNTCKTHWELSEGDSHKLLDCLSPDQVVFGPISMAPDLGAAATTACENSLVDFFNSVIECVNNACGTVRAGRKWTVDSAMHPLNGGDAVRKPDMAFWLASGSEFNWRHLTTFAKVKNCRGKDKEKSSYLETADFVRILISITSTSNETLSFDTSITWEQQPCNNRTVGMKTLDIQLRNNGLGRHNQGSANWNWGTSGCERFVDQSPVKPIGPLITKFSCLGELLVAFLDYVIVSQQMSTSRVVQEDSETQVFSDAGDPPTSPIEMVSQTANCIYMVPLSSQNADPRLVSIPDLTSDHDIVMAMGPQFKMESDLRHTIDMSPLYCTGTWSWMSARLVMAGTGKPVVHEPVDDLKSLFYVLSLELKMKPFTHDLFITSIIGALSHLSPDMWVPVDQVGNNKDLANPEVKVEDELSADGTKEASGAYKFTLSNLMSLPPMLLRPPPYWATAGQGFYGMDSGPAPHNMATEELDGEFLHKHQHSSSHGHGTQPNSILCNHRGQSTGSIL
ncbi:hypothetical protein EDC04DRAFT_2614943 [Pisolithus marmoratus]|nr:hypothetical protein EDC04DRAFT_2614943 [Pisolithus marmoratus]